MKKIILAVFSIALITVACNKQATKTSIDKTYASSSDINKKLSLSKDNGSELLSEVKKYQKELTVFDETKTYSVTFNVSSDNEDYLNQYIAFQTLKIEVLKQVEPNQPADNTPNSEEDTNEDITSTNSISNVLISTNLPSDAVGFKLNINCKKTRYSSGGGAESGYAEMMEFFTLANGIITTNNSGASGLVEKYAKKYSISTWSNKGADILNGWGQQQNFCIKNFNRIKVQINYNNGLNNYNVTFYGSSSC